MEIESNTVQPTVKETIANLEAEQHNFSASLYNSLIQALSNRDIDMLKFIFRNTESELIQQTLTQFTDQTKFDLFISTTSKMLEGFPNESEFVLTWLLAFLRLKKDSLSADSVSRNKGLSLNRFLRTKVKVVESLRATKDKLDRLLAKGEDDIVKEPVEGFGRALITIDERLGVSEEALAEEKNMFQKIQEEKTDTNEQDDDLEESFEEKSIDELEEDEEEEDLLHDEMQSDIENYEDEVSDDEEDSELEKDIENYEQKEKGIRRDN